MELRRAGLRRLLGIDDGGQRLLVDLDRLERVDGLGLRLGDDGRDAFAGPLDASPSRGPAGVLTLFWIPAEPPAGQAIGSGLYGMSAPTITARTPGIVFAADVSIDRMLAWAYGLRRIARWVIPVSLMSSR